MSFSFFISTEYSNLLNKAIIPYGRYKEKIDIDVTGSIQKLF
ncbi:formate--tetrahydrofolate ligase [Vagococcus vulneris]|nr:formate--tetrahydrofolate ligase [Vagococcus vulneris]